VVLWKMDKVRSHGLTPMLENASKALAVHTCDQHLRDVDSDLVDDFSALLNRHRKTLQSLDWCVCTHRCQSASFPDWHRASTTIVFAARSSKEMCVDSQ
jgi:hypothetical protein